MNNLLITYWPGTKIFVSKVPHPRSFEARFIMRKEYVNIISKYKEEFNLKSLRHHRKSQSPKIEHQGTPHFIICTEEEVSLN